MTWYLLHFADLSGDDVYNACKEIKEIRESNMCIFYIVLGDLVISLIDYYISADYKNI